MTVTSFNVPGVSAGARALTELELPTETAFAGESPIMTLAPASKPVPAMVTGVPPDDGPDAGLMLVTSREAAARMRRKTVPPSRLRAHPTASFPRAYRRRRG